MKLKWSNAARQVGRCQVWPILASTLRKKRKMHCLHHSLSTLPSFAKSADKTAKKSTFASCKTLQIRAMRAVVQRVTSASVEVTFPLSLSFTSLQNFNNCTDYRLMATWYRRLDQAFLFLLGSTSLILTPMLITCNLKQSFFVCLIMLLITV